MFNLHQKSNLGTELRWCKSFFPQYAEDLYYRLGWKKPLGSSTPIIKLKLQSFQNFIVWILLVLLGSDEQSARTLGKLSPAGVTQSGRTQAAILQDLGTELAGGVCVWLHPR